MTVAKDVAIVVVVDRCRLAAVAINLAFVGVDTTMDRIAMLSYNPNPPTTTRYDKIAASHPGGVRVSDYITRCDRD